MIKLHQTNRITQSWERLIFVF